MCNNKINFIRCVNIYTHIFVYIFICVTETQLRNTIEELREQIVCKDEKLENEKNKCISLNNTIFECKKQLKSLREAIELEKSNKNELDQQLRAYT